MQTERKKLHRHDESERDSLPRPENPMGVDEAVEMFVEKVSRIEYVDEIRCLKRGHLHEVWTIFAAPRGQYELELPIIRIENELLERLDEPLLDFRAVNTNEVSYIDPSAIAQGSALLWKKQDAE